VEARLESDLQALFDSAVFAGGALSLLRPEAHARSHETAWVAALNSVRVV